MASRTGERASRALVSRKEMPLLRPVCAAGMGNGDMLPLTRVLSI
jgi:hypothetical protein